MVYEDSELTVVNLAVGLGKGVWAGGVVPWTPVDLTDRSADRYDGESEKEEREREGGGRKREREREREKREREHVCVCVCV